MKTELSQLLAELREKHHGRSHFFIEDFLSYLATQNFSMQPFAALRRQHNIKKQVSLSELINFIEVIEITGTVYSQKKLEEFFSYFSFNDEIREFVEKRFHAKVNPGELEDDVYRQNPHRNRSIVELTANSLDAHATQIQVILLDGGYQVIDDGQGMTPEIIFYKLLLPKASNKISEQTIGRFGLGFFTSLAHLKTPDDLVIVSTRARDHHGYYIEFRRIQNEFVVHIHEDDSIPYGTCIEVRAARIRAKEMKSYFKQHLKHGYKRCPILLNGEQVNFARNVDSNSVSQSNVFLLPRGRDKFIALTISGITIQYFLLPESSHATGVVWNLPAATTLSESRNQVRLDTDELREEIKKLIDFADDCPEILQRFAYYNTIASLIANLQANNSSLFEKDNVLRYLQQKLVDEQKRYRLIPDDENFRSVKVENSLYVDKRLLSKGWQEKISTQPVEHLSKGTQLCVVPMQAYTPDKIAFFISDNNRWLFVEDAFYQSCVEDNERWKLDLLCALPPGEMQLTLVDTSLSSKRQTTDVEKPDFHYINPPSEPLHKVFQKHGLLAETENQAVTTRVINEHHEMLLRAPTLMARYPYHHDVPSNDQNISTYYYENKCFYLLRGYEDRDLILCDENFRPLADNYSINIRARALKYRLLLLKIKKLLTQKQTEGEIIFEPDEIFVISVSRGGQFKNILVDSTGRNLLPKENVDDNPPIESFVFNSKYLVVVRRNKKREVSSLYEYQVFDQAGSEIYRGNGKPRLGLQNSSLLIVGEIERGASYFTEEVTTCEKLINIFEYTEFGRKFERIEAFQDGYIGFETYIPYIPFGETLYVRFFSISIHDIDGKYIKDCQYTCSSYEYKEYAALSIQNVHCQQRNEDYCISILYQNGENRLLIVGPERSQEAHFKWALGFPAKYYYDDKERSMYDIRLNRSCPWPDELSPLKIKNIEIEANHFVVHGKNKTAYLLNQNGEILAKGKIEIFHIHHKTFFMVNDNKVIDENGKVLIEAYKVTGLCPTYFPDPCLIIYFEKHFYSKTTCSLYTLDGTLLPNFQDRLLSFPGSRFEFSEAGIAVSGHASRGVMLQHHGTNADIHSLVTPYGYFPYEARSSDYWKQNCFTVKNSARASSIVIGTPPSIQPVLYTPRGYCILSGKKAKHSRRLTSTICFYNDEHYPKKVTYFLRGLSSEMLNQPCVIENLRWLNQQRVPIDDYELGLRFITFAPECFQKLQPFMPLLRYVPSSDKAREDYLLLLTEIENYKHGDKVSIIKLFDILYEYFAFKLEEPLAQKIIEIMHLYGIEILTGIYAVLEKEPDFAWFAMDEQWLSKQFNALPMVLGQLAYFLVFPIRSLLAVEFSIFASENEHDELPISLLNLIAAIRLDATLTQKLQDRSAFLRELEQYRRFKHIAHIKRRLIHAIYHQAAPNKHLYLREFLQNAMDAVAACSASLSDVPTVQVSTFLSRNSQRCVLRLEDSGIGMSLEQVFQYFLVPGASTKCADEHQTFIGGRGVGLFTAYHGAHCIRVKTSIGDEQTHYFELYPQYEAGNVKDIQFYFQTKAESFKGTIIERETLDETSSVMMAALYRRALHSHAAFIDAKNIRVMLNDEQVNRAMPVVHTQKIANFGQVTLYQSKENVITVGGLYVKPIPTHWFERISKRLRDVLLKHGLVIDLPKNMQLNRERNDFVDCTAFETFFLRNPLPVCLIHAYINLFLQGEALLEELPYDFFAEFCGRLSNIKSRNANIQEDADKLNQGKTLENADKYLNDLQALTDLLCFLKFIPYQDHEKAPMEKLSLIDMVLCYQQGKLKKEQCPRQIQMQIALLEGEKSCHVQANEIVTDLKHELGGEAFLNYQWVPKDFGEAHEVKLFFELLNEIAQCFDSKIRIFFSTVENYFDAKAYSYRDSTYRLYWVLINADKQIETLFEAVCTKNYSRFQVCLNAMVEAISHEYTHLCERSNHATHNRSFYLRQREILLQSSSRIDAKKLFTVFCEKAQVLAHSTQCVEEKKSPALVRFLTSQLPVLSENSSRQLSL